MQKHSGSVEMFYFTYLVMIYIHTITVFLPSEQLIWQPLSLDTHTINHGMGTTIAEV